MGKEVSIEEKLESYQKYLKLIKEIAKYAEEIGITIEDQVMVHCTCLGACAAVVIDKDLSLKSELIRLVDIMRDTILAKTVELIKKDEQRQHEYETETGED